MHVDVRAELRDELVALIEQIVRRLSTARSQIDLAVQLRDVLRYRGDVLGGRADALVELPAQGLQRAVISLQLTGQCLCLRKDDLARCRGRGRVRHVLHGVRKRLQSRGKSGFRVREHIVDARGIGCELVGALIGGAGRSDLSGQVIAVHALDRIDAHTAADEAVPELLRGIGDEISRLTAVSRRRNVRDVLARDVEGALERLQGRDAVGKKITHRRRLRGSWL